MAPTYMLCASLALFFNCFVLVAQPFEKVPALHAGAPTKKLPFALAQFVNLTLFLVATVLAVKQFHPESMCGCSVPASS